MVLALPMMSSPVHRLTTGGAAKYAVAAASDEDLAASGAAAMTMKPAGFVTSAQEDRPFALRGAIERLRPGGHEGFAADSAGPQVAPRGVHGALLAHRRLSSDVACHCSSPACES